MASTANSMGAPARPANLALLFQELLTAIVRLRSNRQPITDAEAFRAHMRDALKTAAQEARNRAGYSTDDIRLATLAVVGFLDESVLNTQNPLFNNWVREPLQQELFGTHMAGEVVFQNIEQLLGRTDSHELADVLEVHYLCLLLGYTGRYSGTRSGDLQSIMNLVAAKIRKIRGAPGDLSPSWAPGQTVIQVAKDPWVKRLMITAIVCLSLLILLFIGYKIGLGSGVSDVRQIASQKSN